jgi:hypothetical protein
LIHRYSGTPSAESAVHEAYSHNFVCARQHEWAIPGNFSGHLDGRKSLILKDLNFAFRVSILLKAPINQAFAVSGSGLSTKLSTIFVDSSKRA